MMITIETQNGPKCRMRDCTMEYEYPSTYSKDSGIIAEKEAERIQIVVDDHKKIITSGNTKWKLST